MGGLLMNEVDERRAERQLAVVVRYARILRSRLVTSESVNVDLRNRVQHLTDETWRLGSRIDELETEVDAAYMVTGS